MNENTRDFLSWILLGLFLLCIGIPIALGLRLDKDNMYITETLTTFALLAAFVLSLVLVFTHPYWGARTRAAFRPWFARIGLLLVFVFAALAAMDAISWTDAKSENSDLAAGEPRSLLDRGFALAVGVPEYKFKEKTYSGPFARTEFIDKTEPLKFPGRHVLGTTIDGKDSLYSALKGCKPAMLIGILPLLFSVPLGVLFGVCGGYFGKRVDDIVVYIYSTLASIPSLLLLLALVMALGRSVGAIGFGLGVVGWVGLCRLVRGETMKIRELEYIQAATCLGTPTWKILLRHVLPNLLHIVIIVAVLAFSGQVLAESVLAYLGVGLDNSWGSMIDMARSEISREPSIWWNIMGASTGLFLLVLSMNIVGDVLSDTLDPRMTSKG